MIITNKQYLDAKRIVLAYEEQMKEEQTALAEKCIKEREAKYADCAKNGGHDYRASGGKLSSATEVSCMHCGHKKE